MQERSKLNGLLDCLSHGTKARYKLIEAAIRWSGLCEQEHLIAESIQGTVSQDLGCLSDWPALQLCADRIIDAINFGELRFDDGCTSVSRNSLGPINFQVFIRHVDLKEWISRYYPGERPSFLFSELELLSHPTIDIETVNILLADRKAAKLRLAELASQHEHLSAQHVALTRDCALRQTEIDRSKVPGQRSESTYLNIIGGLTTLLLGKSPGGTPYSSFKTLDSVVSALAAHREGRAGLSERTLWSKLVEARRHLDGSR